MQPGKQFFKTGYLGDKPVHGNFQLAFPTGSGFLCKIFRIAFSLAALLWYDDGQTVFPAQPVAHVPYAVIAALIGIVLVVVYKIDRAENDMVMNVSLVYVSGKDVFILPLCYRVGKLLPDFMGFLIVHFPRLKGLYQVVGEIVSPV